MNDHTYGEEWGVITQRQMLLVNWMEIVEYQEIIWEFLVAQNILLRFLMGE